jgi:hypothetical protein
MDRFRAIAPIEAEPVLRELCAALPPGTLYREWPWAFLGGKTYRYETPRGTTVHLAHATHFGHLVVLVDDDTEGLVDRLRARVELTEAPALLRRAEAATTEAAKIEALCALASVQSFTGGVLLPELQAAAKRALEDPSRSVRLAAIRAIATLPVPDALALLEGREDPENPELGGWREHYRSLANKTDGQADK